MKHLLLAVLLIPGVCIFLPGCSKKDSPAAAPSVSYNLYTSLSTGSGSMPISMQGSGAYLTCGYESSAQLSGSPAGTYDGNTYVFAFQESSGAVSYGIQFQLPADSLPGKKLSAGLSETFNLTPGTFSPYLNQCIAMLSPSSEVVAADSANITISISRYSGGTADGTFSAQFYGTNYSFAQITQGTFSDLPVKSE